MVDPLVLMDEWGTDALRFTLLVGSTPGKDMSLSTEEGRVEPQFRQQDLECEPLRDFGDYSLAPHSAPLPGE